MRENTADALVYTEPGVARIAPVALDPLIPGTVEVETLFTGLSRGTERLVFEGAVPEAEWGRMRAPLQVGDFPFPVRYGYSAVGRVVGPGGHPLEGKLIFALHPHQTRFRVAEAMALPVPEGVPPGRAILAANTETALNAIWDADLHPGMRCLVVGLGMVGSLVAGLLSQRSDLSVVVTDKRPRSAATLFDNRVSFVAPQDVPRTFDVVFHTSASGAGLQTAVDALVFEGVVIEMSWYGDRPVQVDLGGNFHANRLRIVSSQVGHVAPVRRASTSYRDRLKLALAALSDPGFDALITEDVPFQDLPARLPVLLGANAPGIATRIVYA